MTKLEIIDDTVAYYSADVNRRSVSEKRCAYKGPNGKECAFQRVVENDLSEFDGKTSFGFGSPCGIVMEKVPDLKFKPGYEGHESNFWERIQHLHDVDEMWDSNGLSSRGKEYVEEIKQYYS